MKSTKIKQLFYLGIILFLGHFLVLCLHQIYPNKFTSYYLEPIFHQNYNMFVPPPSAQYHLYVFDENKFVADAFRDIVLKHQNNRLAGYEPLLLALSNSIFYFETEAAAGNFNNGKVPSHSSFMLIEKIVKNYFISLQKLPVKNLKLILLIDSYPNKTKRVYFN